MRSEGRILPHHTQIVMLLLVLCRSALWPVNLSTCMVQVGSLCIVPYRVLVPSHEGLLPEERKPREELSEDAEETAGYAHISGACEETSLGLLLYVWGFVVVE